MEKNIFEFKSLGGNQSPHDYRDIDLASVVPASAQMPKSAFVDVSKLPVWHQRKIGACVGHAGAKYGQKLNQIETGSITNLSARFLYTLAKCTDGYPDEGTYPRQLMKMWKMYGIATEDTVPNDTTLSHDAYIYNRDMTAIPAKAFKEALPYRINSYAFPGVTEDGIKSAVLNANGCMLLMKIGKEWWTKKDGSASSWAKEDIIPLRPPQAVVSGHEVYVYGYDYVGDRLRIWIRNSWSDAWGDNGNAYFFHDEWALFLIETVTAIDMPNTLLEYVQSLPIAKDFKHAFNVPIQYRQKGDEVKALQTALYISGELKVDPKDFGFYGDLTAKALKDFQYKYQLATPAEIEAIDGKSCGPKTRAKLNNLFNK